MGRPVPHKYHRIGEVVPVERIIEDQTRVADPGVMHTIRPSIHGSLGSGRVAVGEVEAL